MTVRHKVEIDVLVATPPVSEGDIPGHCKINEISWHGSAGLDTMQEQQYRHAVNLRNARTGEARLQAASDYLVRMGWRVQMSWSGVHGD